jgi:hypothetical protein
MILKAAMGMAAKERKERKEPNVACENGPQLY